MGTTPQHLPFTGILCSGHRLADDGSFEVGDMARGGARQAVDSSSTARGNLTNAQQRPGTVRQAAHDLRQPVAAVLALASAALADEPVPDRVKQRLAQIITEAHW